MISMGGYRAEKYKQQREKVLAKRGKRCEWCGRKETVKNPIQMAHVKPTGLRGIGRGSAHRIQDWINHPEDYAYICSGEKSCHDALDFELRHARKKKK